MFNKEQQIATPRAEEAFSHLIASYFVFVIPCVVLFVRCLTALISQDMRGVFRRMLSLPEDLIFIGFAFVLSGVAGVVPAFTRFYVNRGSNPTTSGLGLLAFVLLAGVLVHLLDSWLVQPEFETFWIANQKLSMRAKKMEKKELEETTTGTEEWELIHWKSLIMASFWWFVNIVFAGFIFRYVAQIVRTP